MADGKPNLATDIFVEELAQQPCENDPRRPCYTGEAQFDSLPEREWCHPCRARHVKAERAHGEPTLVTRLWALAANLIHPPTETIKLVERGGQVFEEPDGWICQHCGNSAPTKAEIEHGKHCAFVEWTWLIKEAAPTSDPVRPCGYCGQPIGEHRLSGGTMAVRWCDVGGTMAVTAEMREAMEGATQPDRPTCADRAEQAQLAVEVTDSRLICLLCGASKRRKAGICDECWPFYLDATRFNYNLARLNERRARVGLAAIAPPEFPTPRRTDVSDRLEPDALRQLALDAIEKREVAIARPWRAVGPTIQANDPDGDWMRVASCDQRWANRCDNAALIALAVNAVDVWPEALLSLLDAPSPAWRKEPPTVEEVRRCARWWRREGEGDPMPVMIELRVASFGPPAPQPADVVVYPDTFPVGPNDGEWFSCPPPGAPSPDRALVEAALETHVAEVALGAHVEQVAEAAERWWLGRRPTAFTEAQHLATPRINCITTDEAVLAVAVAEWKRTLAADALRRARGGEKGESDG